MVSATVGAVTTPPPAGAVGRMRVGRVQGFYFQGIGFVAPEGEEKVFELNFDGASKGGPADDGELCSAGESHP